MGYIVHQNIHVVPNNLFPFQVPGSFLNTFPRKKKQKFVLQTQKLKHYCVCKQFVYLYVKLTNYCTVVYSSVGCRYLYVLTISLFVARSDYYLQPCTPVQGDW